ncbi:MAG: hypothetical protein LKE81_04975 [Acetobacter sp.]|jgi:hypothetical protein|nr:hypothetical protein [Acetobacter sp.]MCH4087713.1 hypothetical protein [Acetobacter sp.]
MGDLFLASVERLKTGSVLVSGREDGLSSEVFFEKTRVDGHCVLSLIIFANRNGLCRECGSHLFPFLNIE